MESNNQVFFKKSTYQNKQAKQKERYIFVMFSFYFLRRTNMNNKKRSIPTCLFDKSRTQTRQMSYST